MKSGYPSFSAWLAWLSDPLRGWASTITEAWVSCARVLLRCKKFSGRMGVPMGNWENAKCFCIITC